MSEASHSTSPSEAGAAVQSRLLTQHMTVNDQQLTATAASKGHKTGDATVTTAASRAARRDLQDLQRAKKAHSRMTSNAATLLLLRHGETAWNVEKRLQGQSPLDPPMNTLGLKQAAVVADSLAHVPLSCVYSSDTARAGVMADMIAAKQGIQVHRLPSLRERNLGVLEGLTHSEAMQTYPEAYKALSQPGDDAGEREGGVETLMQLRQRGRGAVGAIAAQHPGQTVAIVVHGGLLHALYHEATGHSYRGKVFNGGLSRLVVEGKNWALMEWNQIEHLKSGGVDFSTEAFGGTSSTA